MSENSINYYKEYSNTRAVYLRRQLKTIENFINEIPIIDECIGFQIWLDDLIAKNKKNKEKKIRKNK